MNTDYVSLGAAALRKLRQTTARAWQIQKEQLQTILQQNFSTEYGMRYGFFQIRSTQEFQSRVPLSCHGDYEPYIENLLSGGTRQLTEEEPVYFAITSGSTGTPKYVPVTGTDMLSIMTTFTAGFSAWCRSTTPRCRRRPSSARSFR